MKKDQEMSVDEAAELMGVSRGTIYNLVKRGLLPKHERMVGKGRGGERIFFLRSDLERLKGAERQEDEENK